MTNGKNSQRFQIMRRIATSTCSGAKLAETAREALEKSSGLIGLAAGTLILWDDEFKSILDVTFASGENEKALLYELEQELLSLRREQFSLRMQRATGELAHHSEYGRVKKDIARVKTVMAERGVRSSLCGRCSRPT